jgi:hypothetical protein
LLKPKKDNRENKENLAKNMQTLRKLIKKPWLNCLIMIFPEISGSWRKSSTGLLSSLKKKK